MSIKCVVCGNEKDKDVCLHCDGYSNKKTSGENKKRNNIKDSIVSGAIVLLAVGGAFYYSGDKDNAMIGGKQSGVVSSNKDKIEDNVVLTDPRVGLESEIIANMDNSRTPDELLEASLSDSIDMSQEDYEEKKVPLDDMVKGVDKMELEDLEGSGGFKAEREVKSSWKYDLVSNKMRGSVYIISNRSINIENVNVFDDKSDLSISLRDRDNAVNSEDKDVILKVNGKFFCDVGRPCKINVKIDDYQFETDVRVGAQGRSDLLFIQSRGYFIGLLKSGTSMIIEVPFEGIGYQGFVFDIKDLDLS